MYCVCGDLCCMYLHVVVVINYTNQCSSPVNQTTSSAALDVLHHQHCGGRGLVYETTSAQVGGSAINLLFIASPRLAVRGENIKTFIYTCIMHLHVGRFDLER